MKWISLFLLLLMWSCGGKQEKAVSDSPDKNAVTTQVKREATSKLTFPLDFPINDLYQVINRSLPDVLVEDTLQLKKKGHIKLKIEPIGEVYLASYGNNLDVSIPMKVSAEVEKKVFGVKVNKPISLKVRVDMNTQLSIDEDWNMNAACRIQKIRWIEPPIIEILGIKVNLQNKIEQKLQEKSADIENTVCKALQGLVPLREQVTKIWNLIDNTHRVGKKPIDIWLTSKASVFSGHFTKEVKDTLRVIIHTESDLFITPVSGLTHEPRPMPKNSFATLDSENELDINVNIYLPYKQVNELLKAKLNNTELSYEGATISLKNFSTNTANHKLHLQFDIVGDLEATIDAYAYPTLSADKQLIIDSIEYNITSENSLVYFANWVASDQLTEFLKANASISLAHILDSLDSKIVAALNKSKVGGKVGLEMEFTELTSDTLVFTKDGLQWFFDVKGNAHAYLTEQLIP